MKVDVRAHARLHFGFLDMSGAAERRVGGIGLAITRPRCVLRIERAAGLVVEGEQAERIEVLATRVHEALEIRPQARIRVLEAIPQHVGLGSGTQISMALASGIARLRGLDVSIARLSSLMGRAKRSGVGYHLFQRGGLVLEGGHAEEGGPPIVGAPVLLARHPLPREWKILVAIPSAALTLGDEAVGAHRRGTVPAGGVPIDRMARLVLTGLLPALAGRQLARFGAALVDLQQLMSDCFAAVQEAEFHAGGAALARVLLAAGAAGAGQSSWGPAVFAIAANERERRRLADVVRGADPQATLYASRGWNRGALVESA